MQRVKAANRRQTLGKNLVPNDYGVHNVAEAYAFEWHPGAIGIAKALVGPGGNACEWFV